jgi:hypothetical protein
MVISCSFKHGLISELMTSFDPMKALKDSDKTIQSLHHTIVQNLILEYDHQFEVGMQHHNSKKYYSLRPLII